MVLVFKTGKNKACNISLKTDSEFTFFQIDHIWALFWIFSVPLGMFFGLLGLFWGWVQVQKYIWNLLLLTINFVLELQLLVFVYNSTKFGAYLLFLMLPQLGALLPFLSPSGPFFTVWGYFRVSIRLNYILEPTNVEYHFLFWKCSPIFFNFIELGGGGPFCIFWSFRGLFWVWGQVQKLFWDLFT